MMILCLTENSPEKTNIKMNSNTQTRETEVTLSMQPLFDESGRCLPSQLTAPVHNQSRHYFQIEKPVLDFAASYQRLAAAFDIEAKISLAEFEQRVQAILDGLKESEETSPLLEGAIVPFILPQAVCDDIGQTLEEQYLPAVNHAFSGVFPDYDFVNHSPKSLSGQLSVTEDSRHEKLISAMKDDVVVGVYFPCLLEYSIPAAIEQVANMPEQFLLAGGFDTAAAFISAPELLFRKEGYPPLLWLSGLTSDEENVGYHFEAYGYDLTFNRRVHLNQVAEYWASGLTVMG